VDETSSLTNDETNIGERDTCAMRHMRKTPTSFHSTEIGGLLWGRTAATAVPQAACKKYYPGHGWRNVIGMYIITCVLLSFHMLDPVTATYLRCWRSWFQHGITRQSLNQINYCSYIALSVHSFASILSL